MIFYTFCFILGRNQKEAVSLQTLFDKYVHSAIDMILNGLVDGRQEERLKTIIPCSSLNMVGFGEGTALLCYYMSPYICSLL